MSLKTPKLCFQKENKNMQSIHKTVLLNETIEGLNLGKGAIVVDGTFGGGGHSRLLCEKYPDARVIALDQDMNVIKEGAMNPVGNITFVNTNFRNLDEVLQKENIEKVDGIILDLGLSSDQLESSGRGFSFMRGEPLLMTMKENPRPEDVTAKDIVNTWEEKNLADIIYGYGEEQFSRRIAKGIVEARKNMEIKTTADLVKIVEESVPNFYRKGKIHPATKTFQALRIAVNDELGALNEGLEKGFEALKSGGRLSVISFHSLEDRIVKRFYKDKVKEEKGNLINKKPIVPSKEEIKNNNRSRSAKLRIIQKI